MTGKRQMNLVTNWYAVALLTLEQKALVAILIETIKLS